ncbi:MAG TPA: ABC transporter ATP-binding protein [Dehalococcoidia bacterium]|nr:ABC transporter ATP-binding protein [Dehalococcoidia bacterium]
MTAALTRQRPGSAIEKSSHPALDACDLTYLHPGGRGVHDLSLRIARETVLGLIGPNGSGKSTLLNLLSGLLQPHSGSLSVLGGSPRTAAARLGWVFQEQSLDPLLTVRETLALSGHLYGVSQATAGSSLEVVDLTERLDDRVSTLSGGMKRRLELARAIQHAPDLLIMDEPTLGLDLDSRRAIWNHLADLNAAGLTIVVATNDVSEAERVCNDIAFLRDGRLVAHDTPQALKEGLREQSLHLRWPDLSAADFDTITRLDGVTGARRSGDVVRLTTPDGRSLLAAIAAMTSGQIEEIEIRPSSLEDAYFQLTGSPLIDEESQS